VTRSPVPASVDAHRTIRQKIAAALNGTLEHVAPALIWRVSTKVKRRLAAARTRPAAFDGAFGATFEIGWERFGKTWRDRDRPAALHPRDQAFDQLVPPAGAGRFTAPGPG
jgi:hypothetical protein